MAHKVIESQTENISMSCPSCLTFLVTLQMKCSEKQIRIAGQDRFLSVEK